MKPDTQKPDTLDDLDFGPCCACTQQPARNILLLNLKALKPGIGWGCFQCGLPADGAIAVVCDRCLWANNKLIFACADLPAIPPHLRVPLAELTEPFHHDLAKHPELQNADQT